MSQNSSSPNISLSSLAFFRICFGGLVLFSSLRFLFKGWLFDLIIEPSFHFKYFGFDWVLVGPPPVIYILYSLMILACIGILLGWYYRISVIFFFLIFTYFELLDVANYLNHYYFVSLAAFLLIFLPAQRLYSLDIKWRNLREFYFGHPLYVNSVKWLLTIVYIYAGISKLNADWLINAMPLAVWLPAKADLPIIGPLMDYKATAYIFSWSGALYDLIIPFLLWNKKTRPFAFILVVVFHILTWTLFPIGVFPWVMIFSTLIFCSPEFHESILKRLKFFGTNNSTPIKEQLLLKSGLRLFISIFLIIQLIVPFRYLAYPGKLFWTEQGYKFSWRVMLMEKAGYITYRLQDASNGNWIEIQPLDYLSENQNKQLATQPDLILQFAHFLEEEFKGEGIANVKIYADSFVNLQTTGSKRFIDPTVDLTKIEDSFAHKNWILPHE